MKNQESSMTNSQPFVRDDDVLEGGGLILKISKAEEMWGCDLSNNGPVRLYALGVQFLLEAMLQNCETDSERFRVTTVLEALREQLTTFSAVSLN
jgi:hypothetical protein